MIRLHHYCDICGKQMSYIDADGEVCVQGFKAATLTVDVDIRTSSGSSSARHTMHAAEYCGYDCFESRLRQVAHFVSEKHDQMQPLKGTV